MRVTVLGAGVIGVTTAWYLAADGHEVTVIDRQAAPALETSFANGGQISVSHAEPWANPRVFGKLLRWLGREDSPLLWRLRLDPAQWAWGLRFLRECTPTRTRANIDAIVRLGLLSRAVLGDLRRQLALNYDQCERGILHIYTDPREFDHALRQAALMRDVGCERLPKNLAECLAIEPALSNAMLPIVGGIYTPADESGDARRFTETLAQHAAAAGVRFRYGESVAALLSEGGRCTGARLASGETVRGEATVLALGSYSPGLLRPFGVRLPVYPAKGYSATIALPEDFPADAAPTVSLTDDGAKLVYSRLGQRLRIAGTAEFAGHDLTLHPARCAPLLDRARAFFPALATAGEAEFWCGLRPATPSNVPLIGELSGELRDAGLAGLWLNTGHGTLGWTLACGSASLLRDLLADRAPAVDPAPYRHV